MYKYEVGKLYHPEKTSWAEGVQFNIRGGQCELLLFFNKPSFDEIYAVRKLPCEFGVTAIGAVIFFFYKFGSVIPYSDQPFSIHLVPATERLLPKLSGEDTRLILQIMLVEAKTGILKVMRAVSLAPEFSQELLKLTTAQLAEPFDATKYDRQIVGIYAAYPDTKSLLTRCFVFSAGGI